MFFLALAISAVTVVAIIAIFLLAIKLDRDEAVENEQYARERARRLEESERRNKRKYHWEPRPKCEFKAKREAFIAEAKKHGSLWINSPYGSPWSRARWVYEKRHASQLRHMRRDIYARDGRRCRYCGATDDLQIDHILPVYKYPELYQEKSNLQVLCAPCNSKKGIS